MKLLVETTKFNPELVGKAVYVIEKVRDGDNKEVEIQEGPYLVSKTSEDFITLIDSQGRDRNLYKYRFERGRVRLLVLAPEAKYTLEF